MAFGMTYFVESTEGVNAGVSKLRVACFGSMLQRWRLLWAEECFPDKWDRLPRPPRGGDTMFVCQPSGEVPIVALEVPNVAGDALDAVVLNELFTKVPNIPEAPVAAFWPMISGEANQFQPGYGMLLDKNNVGNHPENASAKVIPIAGSLLMGETLLRGSLDDDALWVGMREGSGQQELVVCHRGELLFYRAWLRGGAGTTGQQNLQSDVQLRLTLKRVKAALEAAELLDVPVKVWSFDITPDPGLRGVIEGQLPRVQSCERWPTSWPWIDELGALRIQPSLKSGGFTGVSSLLPASAARPLAVALIAVSLLGIYRANQETAVLQREAAQRADQIDAAISTHAPALAREPDPQRAIRRNVAMLRQLQNRRESGLKWTNPLVSLDRLADLIDVDAGITLNELASRKGLLNIEGNAPSFAAVDSLRSDLTNLDGVSEVRIDRTDSEPGESTVTFALTVIIDEEQP